MKLHFSFVFFFFLAHYTQHCSLISSSLCDDYKHSVSDAFIDHSKQAKCGIRALCPAIIAQIYCALSSYLHLNIK